MTFGVLAHEAVCRHDNVALPNVTSFQIRTSTQHDGAVGRINASFESFSCAAKSGRLRLANRRVSDERVLLNAQGTISEKHSLTPAPWNIPH